MSEIYDMKDISCVHCKIPFPKRMSMVSGKGGKLTKGMIMLCSSCGGAQILGDSEWRPLTKEDFGRLPRQSKEALAKISRGLWDKLKSGAEWSPYAKN
jgi:hypothetical protein